MAGAMVIKATRNLSLAWVALLVLPSCNQYEMFRLAGYQQESFSNEADIVFVVDNSLSMQDEATELARNIGVFIDTLTNEDVTGITTDGLTDAAENYIEYVQNRGRFIDYQLSITTTDVEATYGDLYGDPTLIAQGDDSISELFAANVLCSSTCFDDSTVPSDLSYQCGDPLGDSPVSFEYLECLCGQGLWENNCGSGSEEHLEALFMALCRAVPEPPEECYEFNQFTAADVLSNEGLLRENSTVIPVIVTDEGDGSRRMTTGDGEPDEYEALFDLFGHRMAFAVIGPRIDVCNSGGASPWGVDRLLYFVEETNGRWFDIAEPGSGKDCQVTDFAASLEELGDLLSSLAEQFPLDSVPNVDTIRVFVDDEEIAQAVATVNEDLETEYSAGWGYVPADNAIEFYGTAIPDYNAVVDIYYLPLEGMPRELPF